MKCINKSHPDYIALLDTNPYPIPLLDAKISIWQDQNDTDEFPSLEQLAQPIGDSKIRYAFKTSTAIINKLDKVKQWYKSLGNTDKFWNKVQQDLQIPKEQVVLVKESEGNTIEEKLLDFSAKYNYAITINTAKDKKGIMSEAPSYIIDGWSPYDDFEFEGSKYTQTNEEEFDGERHLRYWKDGKKITQSEFTNAAKLNRNAQELTNTDHYASLTVPGGTNYTENEISTPGITPSIKGHAQFATDNGIGWFRSDEKMSQDRVTKSHVKAAKLQGIDLQEQDFVGSKTRRILEVQSDLFQKSRDIKSAEEVYAEMKKSGELIVDCG